MMRDSIRTLLAFTLAAMSIAGIGSVAVAAPTGSMSGCVQSDNGTPINGAHVVAYNWETGIRAGDAHTSVDGTYTIGDLTLPKYRVKADAEGYLPEYYREGGTIPVVVLAPYPTKKINFTLTPGSSISGYVYQADGLTPIDSARVVAYQKAGGAWEYTAESHTDPEGCYSIATGTGAGIYKVNAEAAGYAVEYYSSIIDPNGAAEVDVAAGDCTDGINFNLDQIGFVSGTTYKADGVTPIAGVHVVAYDSTTGISVDEGFSGANAGAYYINLTPGMYRLEAEAPGYAAEWHADATTFGAATPVSVAGLDETPDVNFSLPTAIGVTTLRARDVTETSARLIGDITSLGSDGEVTVSFVWRTAAGSYSHETPRQVRDTKGYVSSTLTGLAPGTTYYYRAKAAGSSDAVYGGERSLTTADDTAPVISHLRCDTTTEVATITWTTNEPAISQIDFGLTADYSNTTGLSAYPVTSHSINLVDLRSDSTYHYRIMCWDASNNKVVTRDYTFNTDVYYGGMATHPWRIVGFGVVAALGILCCLMWARTK
jgi:hypothetical protein